MVLQHLNAKHARPHRARVLATAGPWARHHVRSTSYADLNHNQAAIKGEMNSVNEEVFSRFDTGH